MTRPLLTSIALLVLAGCADVSGGLTGAEDGALSADAEVALPEERSRESLEKEAFYSKIEDGLLARGLLRDVGLPVHAVEHERGQHGAREAGDRDRQDDDCDQELDEREAGAAARSTGRGATRRSVGGLRVETVSQRFTPVRPRPQTPPSPG